MSESPSPLFTHHILTVAGFPLKCQLQAENDGGAAKISEARHRNTARRETIVDEKQERHKKKKTQTARVSARGRPYRKCPYQSGKIGSENNLIQIYGFLLAAVNPKDLARH